MKKNLIYSGILVSLILVSLVSAGWFTGNVAKVECSEENPCSIKQGNCDSDAECQTGHCYKRWYASNFCECPKGTTWRIDECVDACEQAGGVFCGRGLTNGVLVGNGICADYGCFKCKEGYVFEEGKCVVGESSKCEGNICTMYEGNIITTNIDGESVSLSLEYIDYEKVKVKLNSEITLSLAEGETQILKDFEISVTDIKFIGAVDSINYAEIVVKANDVYTLREGESMTVDGKTISIDYIDSDEVVFMVGGEKAPASGKLIKGDSCKLKDGSYISVIEIVCLEVVGGEKYAKIKVVPAVAEPTETEVTYAGVLEMLNNCVMGSQVVLAGAYKNCNDVCSLTKSICIWEGSQTGTGTFWTYSCDYELFGGTTPITEIVCLCCSA